jgi:lysophospholipase L1-like esterase
MKEALLSIMVFVVSTLIAIGIGEAIIRAKNSSMQSYDIEMWRYAKELKRRSDDPVLGHEHVPSKSAILQSVEIRINDMGLRGAPVEPARRGKRRILFLGSSVTLGWGVKEEDTLTSRLQTMFLTDGQDVEILNAGIGNYNSERYVQRFLKRLTSLEPTDIVVHYFLRDAETLEAGGGNILTRNSELAVMAWVTMSRYIGKGSEKTLEQHYRDVYQNDAPGFRNMVEALTRLSDYAHQHNIRLYLAMTPDVHDLVDYRFDFAHAMIQNLAQSLGFTYIDLLPSMRNLTPEKLWAMPGDPHPNRLGHELMARTLYPALQLAGRSAPGKASAR